jgi:hypothetical protein
LKTYFITIKNIVSEEEMKIIGESPVFLNYLSSVFVFLFALVRSANGNDMPKLRKPKKPCESL